MFLIFLFVILFYKITYILLFINIYYSSIYIRTHTQYTVYKHMLLNDNLGNCNCLYCLKGHAFLWWFPHCFLDHSVMFGEPSAPGYYAGLKVLLFMTERSPRIIKSIFLMDQ